MKQTPLQIAISGIKDEVNEINILSTHNYYTSGYKQALINTIDRIIKLLPYEIEFRNEIWDAGVKAMSDIGVEVRALCDVDEWFNENYTTSPIEFDAKKVAEEMYYYFQALMESPLTRGMKSSEAKEGVKYSLQYSHYTPSQRQQILTELEKI